MVRFCDRKPNNEIKEVSFLTGSREQAKIQAIIHTQKLATKPPVSTTMSEERLGIHILARIRDLAAVIECRGGCLLTGADPRFDCSWVKYLPHI